MIPVLQVGIVLYPGALPLDFVGPDFIKYGSATSNAAFDITHLGESLDTIELAGNFHVKPTKTFAQAKNEKLDIILIPGGGQPWAVGQEVKNFVKWGAEHVEHVLTVCTGSWLLALTGGLDGQKATTNKLLFRQCQEQTAAYKVEWITKARFVQSGKFWTASGVSAGTDMACAFAREICGEKAILYAQEFAEYTSASDGEDPWAKKCGLV